MSGIDYENIIIDRIKYICSYRGISLSHMAAELQWSISKLSKILSGNQQININDLKGIVQVLKVPMETIFEPNFDFGKILNFSDYHGLRDIFIKVAEADFSKQRGRDLWDGNAETNSFINEIISRVFYKELNVNPEVYDIKINHGIINGRQLRISIFTTAKVPGLTRDLTIGYTFVFPEDQGYLSIQLSNGAVAGITDKKALSEGAQVSFYRKLLFDILGEIPEENRPKGNNEIYSLQYDLNHIPSETELVRDLRTAYEIYVALLNKSAKKIYEDYKFALISMYEYNSQEDKIFLEDSREEINAAIAASIHEPVFISSKLKRKVFEAVNYKCEGQCSNKLFIDKTTQKPYLEAHYIIPLKEKKNFKKNLNTEENLAVLCPMCQKVLQYGHHEQREELLVKLYYSHRNQLKEAGFDIPLSQLLNFYHV